MFKYLTKVHGRESSGEQQQQWEGEQKLPNFNLVESGWLYNCCLRINKINLKSSVSTSVLISAFLYNFFDEMNYKLTQADIANADTQHCDSDHLNPFAEPHLKFSRPSLDEQS